MLLKRNRKQVGVALPKLCSGIDRKQKSVIHFVRCHAASWFINGNMPIFQNFLNFINADAALSIALIILERLIENEFACPCNSNNVFVYDVLFSSSVIITICLCVLIQLCQRKRLMKFFDRIKIDNRFCKGFVVIVYLLLPLLIPVLTWTIVWYFHGDYYVCGMTTWNGTWISTNLSFPRKWCYPSGNIAHETLNEMERNSANWFLQSQVYDWCFLMTFI